MSPEALRVQRTYWLLTLTATLATSCIWGINTLFLLDAGLDNTGAFAANAFFTVGQVLFEIPTGVVADTWGRRTSYLLGAATLLATTLIYFAMWKFRAPLLGWALASILMGLGFTFFSGATEAWLADALAHTGARDRLDAVMARGQAFSGAAMLIGSAAGGFVAQAGDLGTPYLIRSALLALTFAAALVFMRDLGFQPRREAAVRELRRLLHTSIEGGLRNPPVRWLMLAQLFTGGVGIYAFYALQPHLLALYGDKNAYSVAGLAAAVVAGTEILAGFLGPLVRRSFSRRTDLIAFATAISVICLGLLAWTSRFSFAVGLLIVWALAFSIVRPMRQAYINGLIPSQQRATILSFDNLMASAGGVVSQPALGRLADMAGYPAAFLASGALQAAALPFIALARREKAPSDSTRAPEATSIAAPESTARSDGDPTGN
ncbi:MAG TPA: MFS transporter [Polyangia bacterium]